MSLVIVEQPDLSTRKAIDYKVGTWFIDFDDQVCVVVLDEKTCEKRVVYSGNLHQPFISIVSSDQFEMKRLLKPGTLLKVLDADRGGD